MPKRGLRQRQHCQWQASLSLQRLWLSAHLGRTLGGRGGQAASAVAVFGKHGIPRNRPIFGGQPRCRVLLGQVLRQSGRISPQHGHRSLGGENGRTAQLLIDTGDGSSAALRASATRKPDGGSGRTSSVLGSRR
jgi:hypothetical protein